MKAFSKKRIWFALIAAQVLFAMNYVASKTIVTEMNPLCWATMRSTMATLCFIGVAIGLRRFDGIKGLKLIFPLALFGLLSNCLNQGLFLLGLHYSTPIHSALLNTLLPIFTVVIAMLSGREKPQKGQVVGMFLAFSGVVFLHQFQDFSFSNQNFLGDTLTLTNCICYSLFLVFSRNFLQKHNPIWSTTWLFIYGTLGLVILTGATGVSLQLPPFNARWIGMMAFAVIGGTFIPYLLVNYALIRTRGSEVAMFVYLQAILAAVASGIVFHEPFTARKGIAALLIFSGIFFGIQRRTQQMARVRRVQLLPRSTSLLRSVERRVVRK